MFLLLLIYHEYSKQFKKKKYDWFIKITWLMLKILKLLSISNFKAAGSEIYKFSEIDIKELSLLLLYICAVGFCNHY